MDQNNPNKELQDVPKKIFEKFIEELRLKNVSNNVVEQLDEVLNQESISEDNLRNALFTSNTNV